MEVLWPWKLDLCLKSKLQYPLQFYTVFSNTLLEAVVLVGKQSLILQAFSITIVYLSNLNINKHIRVSSMPLQAAGMRIFKQSSKQSVLI